MPSDVGCGILAGTRTYTNIPAEGIPRKGHWMGLKVVLVAWRRNGILLSVLVTPTRLDTNIGLVESTE